MPGPLENLVVVEAARVMAGAIAGVLFADHGADVIKVEPKGGAWFAHKRTRKGWDRGKASLELDIEADGDRARLVELLKRADVFIHDFEEADAARLGLDYATLKAVNPGLVVCALTAYGADTPMAGRPYGESLAAARLGAMIEKGNPHRPDTPFYLGHPAMQYGQAFIAVIDILAGLRAKNETGFGQDVEASLLDSFLAQSPMNWWWHPDGLSYIKRPAKASTTGTPFGYFRLITGLFQCGDGEYLQVHSGGPGGFKTLTSLLGFGDRIQTIDGPEMAVTLSEDEHHAVRVEIYDAFKRKSREEWLNLFYSNDIATLPVLRPAEALHDAQVQHMGQCIRVEDPECGVIEQAGPALRFRDVEAAVIRSAPAVGQDNGRLPELLARPVKANGGTGKTLRHALEGVRILDFSSFFACGYSGRLMSDLGADVIKIETAAGDQMRPLPDPFEACQRGKRDIVVDVKSEAGLEVIRKLVATADVVVHNWRPGKAEKAGIGYEDLRAIRPDLIYGYLPGYGSSGPKAKLKSFAPLISGFCGLLYEGAGKGNAPVPSVYGNEDYNNGFLGAIGVLVALERRYRTGQGGAFECPQVHSSLFTSSEHFLDADGEIVWGLQMGQDQMGFSATDRLFQTRDGWLCIACNENDRFRALASAIGRPGLAQDARFASPRARDENGEALSALLEPFFAERTSEEAFAALDAAGAPCEIAREEHWLPEFFKADWAEETGRVFDYRDSINGHVRQIGMMTRLKGTPGLRRGPAPRLGEHTREVLAELGYENGRIDDLVAMGAVAAP
jgi:crotonobetainyl-CoA:carnitine CoA-transferase CaiB-like acyl-CoA transferase